MKKLQWLDYLEVALSTYPPKLKPDPTIGATKAFIAWCRSQNLSDDEVLKVCSTTAGFMIGMSTVIGNKPEKIKRHFTDLMQISELLGRRVMQLANEEAEKQRK